MSSASAVRPYRRGNSALSVAPAGAQLLCALAELGPVNEAECSCKRVAASESAQLSPGATLARPERGASVLTRETTVANEFPCVRARREMDEHSTETEADRNSLASHGSAPDSDSKVSHAFTTSPQASDRSPRSIERARGRTKTPREIFRPPRIDPAAQFRIGPRANTIGERVFARV